MPSPAYRTELRGSLETVKISGSARRAFGFSASIGKSFMFSIALLCSPEKKGVLMGSLSARELGFPRGREVTGYLVLA